MLRVFRFTASCLLPRNLNWLDCEQNQAELLGPRPVSMLSETTTYIVRHEHDARIFKVVYRVDDVDIETTVNMFDTASSNRRGHENWHKRQIHIENNSKEVGAAHGLPHAEPHRFCLGIRLLNIDLCGKSIPRRACCQGTAAKGNTMRDESGSLATKAGLDALNQA